MIFIYTYRTLDIDGKQEIRMTLKEISEKMGAEIIHTGITFDSLEIINISAGDMMSEVLVGDEENRIIITALTTDQVIRTADIVEAVGIILINGKKPQQSMKKLAEESNITLLSTKMSMFRTCIKLGTLLDICN
jgi:hypothetical protein